MSLIGTKSIDFDGANDRIVVGDIAALNFNALTQSFSGVCWCRNPTGAAGWRTLFQKYDDATTAGWLFRMNDSETLSLDLLGTGIDGRREEASHTQLMDRWRSWLMAAFSYDHTTGTIKLYLQGVELPSTTVLDNLVTSTATTASFDIGGRPAAHWWLGRLHGAMVYGDVITPTEVEWLFNDGAGNDPLDGAAPDNLIAYWPLGEGDTYPTVGDRAGGWQYSPLTTSTEMNNGTTDERAEFPSPLTVPFTGQAFTMGCWFKSTNTGGQVLMTKHYTGSDHNWGIWFGGSQYRVIQSSTFQNWAYRGNSGFTYANGSWWFVALIHDGVDWANVKMYVGSHGYRPITGSGSMLLAYPSTSGKLVVGGMLSSTEAFVSTAAWQGQTCHEFFYDKALTTTELNAIYNNGSPTILDTFGAPPYLVHWSTLGDGCAIGTDNMVALVGSDGTYVNGDSGDFVADVPAGPGGYDGTMTNMDSGDIVTDSPQDLNLVSAPDISEAAYPGERLLDTTALAGLDTVLESAPDIGEAAYPVERELVLAGGGGAVKKYKMRAIDSNQTSPPRYITWTSDEPDFLGAGYTGGTPTPLGSMVGGSAVVVSEWEADG